MKGLIVKMLDPMKNDREALQAKRKQELERLRLIRLHQARARAFAKKGQ